MDNKSTTARISGKFSWLITLILLSAIAALLIFIKNNLKIKNAYAVYQCDINSEDPQKNCNYNPTICHCLEGDLCSGTECNANAKINCSNEGRKWCINWQEFGYTCCVAGYKCGNGGIGCIPPTITKAPPPPDTATPTPPRRDLCKYATTSKSVMVRGESTLLQSKASEAVIGFWYAFYNMDNLYGPNNPKPICVTSGGDGPLMPYGCPSGTHHLIYHADIISFDKTLGKRTLNYDNIFVTDYNDGANNQVPSKVQFNAYFLDQYGKLSLYNPNCVKWISRADIPTITPTPTLPLITLTKTPTPTKINSPTPTPPTQLICNSISIYVDGKPISAASPPKIGSKLTFVGQGSGNKAITSMEFTIWRWENNQWVYKNWSYTDTLITYNKDTGIYTGDNINPYYPFTVPQTGTWQVRVQVLPAGIFK